MTIHVALSHITRYRYDRPVALSPQVVRLRPAPHTRTPVHAYSLKVRPEKHFINWQQDPQSNWLARFVFQEKTRELSIEVDLVAEMSVINPFDFFLEPHAEKFPFQYCWRPGGNKPSNAAANVGYGIGPAISAAIGATSRIGWIACSPSSSGPAQQATMAMKVFPCRSSGMKGSGGAIWNAGNSPSCSGASTMKSR